MIVCVRDQVQIVLQILNVSIVYILNALDARFESNASAARAKQQLDGADIYAGCCTLKIEYAKVCSN